MRRERAPFAKVPPAQRSAAIELLKTYHAEGKSSLWIAAKLNLNESTIKEWARQLRLVFAK